MNTRSLYENCKKVYNSVCGVKKVADFQETGTLTPEEFLKAGDELVQKMPVWMWAEGEENIQDFFPRNKKYLVYRGAPCYQRAPDFNPIAGEGDDEGEDGWLVTRKGQTTSTSLAPLSSEKKINWDDDDDSDNDEDNANDLEEKKCRLYDVYMVYDQYYRTPRIFFIGYAEDHLTLLTKEEMMQDVYAANRDKTVSIDPHPFLKAACISIHPCRHAETMKRLIRHMRERYEKEHANAQEKNSFVFPTHMAFFLFLKFISSVVPTIEYDLSTSVDI